jgi:hypothetical protein
MTFLVEDVDHLLARGGRWMPRWGWHDDHRVNDKTPAYQPAFMQVRGEFAPFLTILRLIRAHSVLQLGIGPCDASHIVWRAVCGTAVSIDLSHMISSNGERYPGASTHTEQAKMFARLNGPYDLLFIDAGHSQEDCALDEADYCPLVRTGGIVAFHDALPRAEFPEVGVWRHLAASKEDIHTIGEEVGIAWYKKTSSTKLDGEASAP